MSAAAFNIISRIEYIDMTCRYRSTLCCTWSRFQVLVDRLQCKHHRSIAFRCCLVLLHSLLLFRIIVNIIITYYYRRPRSRAYRIPSLRLTSRCSSSQTRFHRVNPHVRHTHNTCSLHGSSRRPSERITDLYWLELRLQCTVHRLTIHVVR